MVYDERDENAVSMKDTLERTRNECTRLLEENRRQRAVIERLRKAVLALCALVDAVAQEVD